MLCNAAPPVGDGATYAGADPLDAALWASPAGTRVHREAPPANRLAALPFDHDRRMVSVVLESADGCELVTKGAPESVLERCVAVPAAAQRTLTAELAAGARVVAVARRPWHDAETLTADSERGLGLVGLLVFLDQPKASAAPALTRLHRLGIDVKVVTGDNPLVAASVCRELGLPVAGTLTGQDLDGLDDDALDEAVTGTTVFARVSPNQKARIVASQRRRGLDLAFLGDGVNDAIALHAADVGVSVDSAADVAKDAADIVLLEKDLDVLADGVVEGRRIFGNTMKYVLMGTSSNFGNMFSAAVASAVLPFLPMLPSQILLNNLLYDSSQLAIPTDNVDEDQLLRPAHWDLGLIRRFMLGFGPLSSLFDFATFAILLWGFGADAPLFHSTWFVESLATQTLVIFVIRTRRSPWRSHPSVPLLASAILAVLVGATLPFTPFAPTLGFVPLLGRIMASVAALVLGYLLLAEIAKRRVLRPPVVRARRTRQPGHRVHRRAARFSSRTTPHGDSGPDRRSGPRRDFPAGGGARG
jgi:Mg2+-importing ATPase